MTFLNNLKRSALAGIILAMGLVSCQKDLTTVGSGVIGSEPFTTGKATYPVFAYNKKIKAVQTNKLPIYQLGVLNDPIYGTTEAQITTQIQLASANPSFGAFSQQTEDISESDNSETTIPENETIKEVFLYIPFLTAASSQRDRDADGVDDLFDVDPEDPNSDSDGDGVTDNSEKVRGTDPLNVDTDGDGITDDEDTETTQNVFAKKVQLDSIYGKNIQAPVTLKVERSTYFLRDLDPNSNFQEAQEYYSSQQFSPAFVSDLLFEGEVSVSNEELLFFKEDDPDTADIDESKEVGVRLAPGIRVPLDASFFQQNILDKEGSSDLLSQANFANFFRGLHLSIAPGANDIMFLFDLRQANITMTYSYESKSNDDSGTGGSGTPILKESNYVLSLLTQQQNGFMRGNAVNTFLNDAFPPNIADKMDNGVNAENLFVKGGSGSYTEIKLFDENNGVTEINEIKANNWIINEANLVFYLDRAKLDAAGNILDAEGKSIEPPRLYLFNAETNAFLYDITSDPVGTTSLNSYPQYDGLLEKSADGKGLKYTVRITKHLNNMVLRDSLNATLGVALTPEIGTVGAINAMLEASNEEKTFPVAPTLTPLGTVLLGPASANQEKRLKLEIFYTQSN